MNNSVFRKTMEKVKNNRDIKLAASKVRRNQLVLQPNYHTSKSFSDNLLTTVLKITDKLMNKPIYLGPSILKITKIVMFEVWYNYVKPKYCENVRLCYMNTDNSIVYIKAENI